MPAECSGTRLSEASAPLDLKLAAVRFGSPSDGLLAFEFGFEGLLVGGDGLFVACGVDPHGLACSGFGARELGQHVEVAAVGS